MAPSRSAMAIIGPARPGASTDSTPAWARAMASAISPSPDPAARASRIDRARAWLATGSAQAALSPSQRAMAPNTLARAGAGVRLTAALKADESTARMVSAGTRAGSLASA